MTDELRILPASEVPHLQALQPLHPSEELDLACAHKFAALLALRRDGHKLVNIASRRGTLAHDFVLGEYVPHLVNSGKNQDHDFWNDALKVFQCTGDTRALLESFLPTFKIDPETVYAVEKRYLLDSKMEPTESWTNAALTGKPDLITIESPHKAKIPDLKTQWRIVDAESIFQSRGYSLIVLQLLEFVDEVEFELVFVRWNNAKRSVTFTRHHLPHLKATALKLWQRKIELTRQAVTGDLEEPVSGPHCVGCPLQFTCPLHASIRVNPYSLNPEELIIALGFADQFANKAREVLKDLFLNDQGPSVTDGIGRTYTPGWAQRTTRKIGAEGTFFDVINIIKEWEAEGNEKRGSLFEKLRVSGLTSYLKAKFREPLLAELIQEGCITEQAQSVFKILQSGLDNSEEANEWGE